VIVLIGKCPALANDRGGVAGSIPASPTESPGRHCAMPMRFVHASPFFFCPHGAKVISGKNTKDLAASEDKEIDLSDNVCLVFSDIRKQHYVSLTGRAELSDDRAKIKRLWSNLDSAFWSDENDPSIRVLKITPTIAEYWDHADAAAIASTVEMVKAALTGSRPDLRSNEKVELS
jgi:hypothetical protein